jgi:hypothetical protein
LALLHRSANISDFRDRPSRIVALELQVGSKICASIVFSIQATKGPSNMRMRDN